MLLYSLREPVILKCTKYPKGGILIALRCVVMTFYLAPCQYSKTALMGGQYLDSSRPIRVLHSAEVSCGAGAVAPDCGQCGSGVSQCRGECYWLQEVHLCLHTEVFSAPPYIRHCLYILQYSIRGEILPKFIARIGEFET